MMEDDMKMMEDDLKMMKDDQEDEVDDQEEVFQPLQEEGLELEEAILVVAVQEEDLLGHSEHLEEGLPSLEHQVEDHEWELHDP